MSIETVNMTQIIGIVLSFIIIFIFSIKKINLAISIILSSIILAVSSSISFERFFNIVVLSLTDKSTIEISLGVTLIGMLGYFVKEFGLISEMISELRKKIPLKIIIAFIPATFGLLPMPGGALFSAPLIESEANEMGISPEKKSFINLLFRHIWFFVFPITSSMILTSILTGISPYELSIIQFPSFLACLFFGYMIALRPLKNFQKKTSKINFFIIFRSLSPIIIVILLNLSGVNLQISLFIGLFLIFFIKKIRLINLLKHLIKSIPFKLTISIISLMIFRFILIETKSLNQIFLLITSLNIPFILIITIIPFIIGMTVGNPTNAIGINFSLISPIVQILTIPLTSIIYISTFFGYLISPIHLCFILSNSYYKAETKKVYKFWIPFNFVIYIVGLIIPLLMYYSII